MKRLMVIVLALSFAAPVFAGGGQEEGEEGITIRLNQHGANFLASLQEIVLDYPSVQPGVNVEVSRLGGDDFWAALRTVVASGDVHDMFAMQAGSMFVDFQDAGLIEPIDDLAVLDQYPDSALEIGRIDGVQYGIPIGLLSMGVMYNVDIFEELDLEVPRTIGELEAVVEAVSDAGYTPFAGYYNDAWTLRHLFDMVHASVVGDPVTFVAEMASGTRDSFRVDGIDRALDVIDLMHANVQDRPFDATFGDATALVGQSEAVMIIQGSWSLNGIRDVNPDFNPGFFGLPISDDPSDAKLAIDSGVVWGVYADSAHLEETKEFMNWITSLEQQQRLGSDAGALMLVNGYEATGPLAPVGADIQDHIARGATHRWGFNKWPTGFDMDVVAPAMQNYLRTNDRDALFDEIDSQYPF